jgi:hypothetical protein
VAAVAAKNNIPTVVALIKKIIFKNTNFIIVFKRDCL